ncbi:MAG TPA: S-methyl-5-thioribose-1-phosphate isomerase [Gemmatimonadaceae bacterium]|nr:S-methyl-5-thioribose-1-phosphate isomerase [Gemmatimonadaceae bacterium]
MTPASRVRAHSAVTPVEAVRWAPEGRAVRIIDQRELPHRLVERDLGTVAEVGEAIRTLAVRGAPAIGICGAMGLVVALRDAAGRPPDEFGRRLAALAAEIRGARPTGANLAWAIDRMLGRAAATGGDPRATLEALRAEATAILEEDRAMCRRIGEHGVGLLQDPARVLTHCNAGALATGGIGTALAPVYVAAERGCEVRVFATETRPLLQGSRLTIWELMRAGVPATLLTDSMAGSLMRAGEVDLVLVGADRIASNGDAANKIGTYTLAVLARHHGIPFYVAAPSSSLDPRIADGSAIVIEERAPDEVRQVLDRATAPGDAPAWNPAFDVTPAELITAIITDRGVHRPPYDFTTGR